MQAAQVSDWSQPPEITTLPRPLSPSPDSELRQINVEVVGIHQLVKLRASGKHYTSRSLPHTPGVDGVGTLATTGEAVYFSSLGGSMVESINVPSKSVVPLPATADKATVAALTNPAMASWMGIRTRTKDLPKDFTILILGVTGVSGKVAVHIAKYLGAGKVIGVGRNPDKMRDLGLDQIIQLAQPASETDFSALSNFKVDVVLDFLYGDPANSLIQALPASQPVQWVQVGSLAGLNLNLSAFALKSKDITIRGSGPGAWSMGVYEKELEGMVNAVTAIGKRSDLIKLVKFADVTKAWSLRGEERIVVEIGTGH